MQLVDVCVVVECVFFLVKRCVQTDIFEFHILMTLTPQGDIIRQGMAVLNVNGKSLEGLELSGKIMFMCVLDKPVPLTDLFCF